MVIRLLLVFAVALFALLLGGSSSSVSATVSAALGTMVVTGILGGLVLAWHALRR